MLRWTRSIPDKTPDRTSFLLKKLGHQGSVWLLKQFRAAAL